MALERAPAEILALCLREAHSPEDVVAAIRASPAFLHAFRCQEYAVLKSVLERCMSVDALHQALLVTTCPVWEEGDSGNVDADLEDPDGVSEDGGDNSTWAMKMELFDLDCREQTYSSNHYLLTIRTLTAICRLRANVNRIIADYIAFTKSVSDIRGPEPAMYAPSTQALEGLSEEELERLQGTFLRYELFCRYCGWPYFHSWIERLDEVSLGDFHFMECELEPWAREGLVVVHRYVMAKYTAMFQEVVEDFTITINATSEGNDEPLKKSSHPPVRELLGEDGPKFLLEIGWRSSNTFDMGHCHALPKGWGQGYVTVCADNFSRLGLGFLLNTLRSDRQSRRDLIRDVFDIFCPREGSWFPQKVSNFLYAAEEYVYDDSGDNLDGDLDDDSLEMMKSSGNSAWKDLISRFRSVDMYIYTMYKDIERLRKLGWVFWDDKRLSDLGIAYPRHHDDGNDGTHVEHSMELQPHISAQQLYGERRLRAPILTVLRKRISRESWSDKIVPQFYTKPHHGFRDAEMRKGPCKSSERLMEIVDLAYQVALDRCQ